jgi:hypothetical protein
MPDLKGLRLKEVLLDLAETGRRTRLARIAHSEAMAATLDSITRSRELLTEADAMLARGDKAFIEEYYRKARKG